MEQLIIHLVGDYVTQSDWMAENKTKKSFPAFVHALIYSLPFFMITNVKAVAVIFVTHFFIDRYRLVKYLLRLKEWRFDEEWGYITTGEKAKPQWMWVWLMIITDNTLHLVCNYVSIKFLS